MGERCFAVPVFVFSMNTLQTIENSVLEIRGIPVLLDSDVATFYGVETKHVNQAVKNNPDKFPTGYIIELSKEEWEVLRSKISTSSGNEIEENLRSKFLTSSWGGQRYAPKVFTERGLWMLSTILKSPKATETTLAIIEAFAKIRELGRSIRELADETSKADKNQLMQKAGAIITDILADDLEPLESETTYEVNLAMFRFKHTVKQGRKSKPRKNGK